MLRRDPCVQCGQPVFLAERLMVSSARLLYHRTCFRCARCNSQLTLANYYETEDGRFCCETCPDEERTLQAHSLRAPLATEDDISSSEPSRPSSVHVDTIDLHIPEDRTPVDGLSEPVCDQVIHNELVASDVHSVDKVKESSSCNDRQETRSETEDDAKDLEDHSKESLSIVQMRRRLFEKEISARSDVTHAPKRKGLKNGGPLHDSGQNLTDSDKEDAVPICDQVCTDDMILQESHSGVVEDKGEQVKCIKEHSHMGTPPIKDNVQVESDPQDKDDRVTENEVAAENSERGGELVVASESVEECADISASYAFERTDRGDPSLAERTERTDHPSLAERVDISDLSPHVRTERSDPLVAERTEESDHTLPAERRERSDRLLAERTEESDDPLLTERTLKVDSLPSERTEGGDDHLPPERTVTVDHLPFELTEKEDPVPSELTENEDPVHSELAEKKDPVPSELAEKEDPVPSKLAEKEEPVPSELAEKEDPVPSERPKRVDLLPEGHTKEDDSVPSDHAEKSDSLPHEHVPERDPVPHKRREKDTRASSKTLQPPPRKPANTTTEHTPVNRPVSYPSELNPFGEDLEEDVETSTTKDSSNPFDSSEEEEEPVVLREKSKPPLPTRPPQRPNTHIGIRSEASAPPERVRILVPASLNPFWDDDEEPNEGEEAESTTELQSTVSPQKRPVPKPRTVMSFSPESQPPERTPGSPLGQRSTLLRSSGRFGSANSLSSVVSSTSTFRRKRHAPPPPPTSNVSSTTISPRSACSTPGRSASFSPSSRSIPASPTLSSGRSTLGRSRKSRPAPPPPSLSPVTSTRTANGTSQESILEPKDLPSLPVSSTPKSSTPVPNDDSWQGGKLNKDEINRNRQNQLTAGFSGETREETQDYGSFNHGDKSSHGQWKRKKGPAPPRPIPQRRQIRIIPLKELKRELDDIEVLQLELERQGVDLERKIRIKFDENPTASESSMTPDVENLILQLFELVNEKNELFRKQAELMYLRRQQRLEEEHADIEYQIRCLMDQPERNKTDSDKENEEKLIQRLVEIVERRNEIVECLERDRQREAEEDNSIHTRLELFATKSLALNEAYINDLYKSTPALTCCARKEKKKKKDKDKTKKGTLKLHKKDKQMDADKDIDETEVEQTSKEKKSKKKWF